jgi:hypothetical protein
VAIFYGAIVGGFLGFWLAVAFLVLGLRGAMSAGRWT